MLFFFNDTATTEIYTLSLHDALPIFWRVLECRQCSRGPSGSNPHTRGRRRAVCPSSTSFGGCASRSSPAARSEEHTSELQSRLHLVCRLLLEKKKNKFREILSHRQLR